MKEATWMNGKSYVAFFLKLLCCGDIVIEMLKIVQNCHEILVLCLLHVCMVLEHLSLVINIQ